LNGAFFFFKKKTCSIPVFDKSNVAGFFLIFVSRKLNAMASKSKKYEGCYLFSFSMCYQENGQ